MDKNKGSYREPSCVFKTITVIVLILLAVGTINSLVKESTVASSGFSESDKNLFLNPSFASQESSEIIVSQQNTLHSLSPLYLPSKIQIFGVQTEKNLCEREIVSYKVKEGDNLSVIADQFEISIETIVIANELKGKTIKPGQDLVILPVTGIFHMAQKGDTVSSVASKYESKKEDIISCNQIEEEKLYAGDILIVPGGKMPKIVAPSSSTGISSPTTNSSSWLIPPTSGRISQRLHWHNAVDIANNCGTPIYAAASGRIQQTGYHRTAGSYIRIQHSNGIITFYGHLSKIIASTGQSVTQGGIIGYMGNTGYTIGPTGCHVHFEVRGGTNPFARYPLNHRF